MIISAFNTKGKMGGHREGWFVVYV